MTMITAFIGLGSNSGDRLGNLGRAVDAIAHLPETHVEAVSNAYESEPAYVTDQPAFVNAVAQVRTALEAEALLAYLLDIEAQLGRVRLVDKGPRTIDLDLLLYGDEEQHSDTLTLPHPGIGERDFVVTPLLEIAPRTHLPDGTLLERSKTTVGEIVADLGPVPDVGAGHNEPVDADSWVVVAESSYAPDPVASWDSALQLRREVLEGEGVPFAFDPHEPGLDMDPFGLPTTFKLLVPVEYEQRAKELFAELDAAPLIYPEELAGAQD
jgi:2-amino-4-hydroxy-6-hydroxymethyldihydropteridine diphosphokinase